MATVTGRLKIALSTSPDSPVIFRLSSQDKRLVSLIIGHDGTAAPNECGVRILSSGVTILPAMGSASDSAFSGNAANYAPLLSIANGLELTIDRLLSGPPYDLTFMFYNAKAADVYAFIFARCEPDNTLIAPPVVKEEESRS